MTFIYKLDLYPIKIYRMYKNELPISRLLQVRQTCRQTYGATIIYHAASRFMSITNY